jgi:hypothetical protein
MTWASWFFLLLVLAVQGEIHHTIDGIAYTCVPVVSTRANGLLTSTEPVTQPPVQALLLPPRRFDDPHEFVPLGSSKGLTYFFVCIFLVCLGGIMSGLTVGYDGCWCTPSSALGIF